MDQVFSASAPRYLFTPIALDCPVVIWFEMENSRNDRHYKR